MRLRSGKKWAVAGLTTVAVGVAGMAGAAPAGAVVAHQLSSSIDGTQTPSGVFVPGSLARDAVTGDLYVADLVSNTVEKINATTGACVYRLTGTDAADSPDQPCGTVGPPTAPSTAPFGALGGGVAVDPSTGDVYVADSGNNVVDKFSSSGHYLSQLTGFSSVSGVAVSSSGEVYAADTTANLVDEFDSSGVPVGSFAVASPRELAVDAAGNVYCVTNSNLEKYVGGSLAAVIDNSGHVQGVGADPAVAGNVFAEEYAGTTLGNFIAEYTSSGQLIYRFGINSVAGAQTIGALAVNSTSNTVYGGDDPSATLIDAYSPITLPDVATGAGTPVDGSHETIAGTLNPQGIQASCGFEYGSDPASLLQSAPCVPAGPFTGSADVPITAQLSGLDPNTTYYFRVNGSNVNGSNDGTFTGQNPGSFTTAAIPPAVTPVSSSNVTAVSAALNGSVDPKNSSTSYTFQYGTTTGYGLFAPYHGTSAGAGLGPQTVSQIVNGLQPGALYHYRLVATSQAGTTMSPDQTFTTGPGSPPQVGTGGASAIAQTSAIISGTIDGHDQQTHYEFDLGLDASYGTQVFGDAGASAGTQTVTLALQSLAPGTTYHYRLLATNPDGTVSGSDQSFTTPGFAAVIAQPVAPPIVASPPVVKPPPPLTNAQKLKSALKVCAKKKSKKQRASCDKKARKKYAPAKKAKKK